MEMTNEIIVWFIGLQGTIIVGIIAYILRKASHRIEKLDADLSQKMEKLDKSLSEKIDKLDDKVTDIDRRVCRMEGAMHNKEGCVIKASNEMRKAE